MSNSNPIGISYGSSFHHTETSEQTENANSLTQTKHIPNNQNKLGIQITRKQRKIDTYNKSLPYTSQISLTHSLEQTSLYFSEAKINIENLFKPLISENTKLFMLLSNEEKLEKTCDLVAEKSLSIDKTRFINGINKIISNKKLTSKLLVIKVFNFLDLYTNSELVGYHFTEYYDIIGNTNDTINILEAIALALSFDFFITTKAKLNTKEVACTVNIFTMLAFINLGFNPWIIFDLSAEQFNFICRWNKLVENNFLNILYNPPSPTQEKYSENTITSITNNIVFLWAKFIPPVITNKAITNKEDLIYITQISFETVFVSQIINMVLEKKPHKSTPHKPIIDINKLSLGVELEFITDKSSGILYSLDDYYLDTWKITVSEQAQKFGVDFNFEGIDCDDYINFFGWGYKVFIDGPCVLETTPMPYKFQQEHIDYLVIQGKKTPYKMSDAFNHFIFDVAKISKLQGLSGHRHVDIRAFASSPEMLLRLYVNFQNYAFMPKIFERIDHLDYFAYLTNKDPYLVNIMNQIITTFNEAISKKEWSSKTGSYKSSAELALHLYEHIPLAVKNSPLALHHIEPQEPGEPSVKNSPTSTMEFRFPPCPTDFNDLVLFDTLLIAEIKATEQDIKHKAPLELISQNPMHFTKEQAIAKFNEYLCSRELNPEIFKPLIRKN